MLIELSSSELMALKDLVLEHIVALAHGEKRTEVYIDVANQVETTPEDLLLTLTDQEPV